MKSWWDNHGQELKKLAKDTLLTNHDIILEPENYNYMSDQT